MIRHANDPKALPPRFYVEKRALSIAQTIIADIANKPDIEHKGCVLNIDCGHYAMLLVETNETVGCHLCGGSGLLIWVGGNGLLYGCVSCNDCENLVFDRVEGKAKEIVRLHLPEVVELMDVAFEAITDELSDN